MASVRERRSKDRTAEPPSSLDGQFPLYVNGEYDFYFQNFDGEVALDSRLSSNLKRKIVAAFIGERAGLKSIDYVLRSYLQDVEYPDQSGPRLDREVREHVKRSMEIVANAATILSFEPNKPGPFHIALFGLVRAKFSMEICCYAVQRGALFEAVACQRMMLEKLAFASRIIGERDDVNVLAIKPQSCLGHLNVHAPMAGRFYGWLSRHAHWDASAHVQAFVFEGDKVGHLFASVEWKALSFLSTLVLIDKYLCFLQSAFPHDMPLSGKFRHYHKDELEAVASGNLRYANAIVDALSRNARCVELLDMLSTTR